jgi:hypothetical protein
MYLVVEADEGGGMINPQDDHQLGDFIKGRLLFIEDYCRKHGLDKDKAMEDLKREALRIADNPERKDFLENRLFSGVILSSSHLPDWVDKVFLEAMTIALKGPGAALYTTTSKMPCITFEAGRFNAHRQAESVFRVYFQGKRPEDWLKKTFITIYRSCYGDAAADRFRVEEVSPKKFNVIVDNQGLEKASRTDCSTGVGYLYGALEKLGADDPVVTHDRCGAIPGAGNRPCVFEVSWK